MLTIVKENINGRITPDPKNLGKTFFELVSASIKDLNAHSSLEGYDAIGLTAWKITGNVVRQLGLWLRAEGHVDGDAEEAQVKSLADLADLITQLATKMVSGINRIRETSADKHLFRLHLCHLANSSSRQLREWPRSGGCLKLSRLMATQGQHPKCRGPRPVHSSWRVEE